MITAFLFAAASLAFGYAVASRIGFAKHVYARAGIAIAVGFAASTWLCFLASFAFGSLTEATILLSSLALLTAAIFLRTKAKTDFGVGWEILFIAAAFAPLLWINAFTMMAQDANGNLVVMGDAWADHSTHVSITESFVERNNFPPKNPFFAGAPLAYPFLADFLSAILLKGGFSLRDSFVAPNLLFGLSLVLLVFVLAESVSRKRAVACFALLLFFFNGTFGIFYALDDAAGNPAVLVSPEKDYAHMESLSLHFENLYKHFLVSQRSLVFGLPLAVIVYLILFELINGKTDKKNRRALFLAAGSVAGLLPLIHTHSFLAVAVVSGILFLIERRRDWIWFFAPFALLAAPQLVWLRQVPVGSIDLISGWAPENEGKNVAEIAWFWIRNTGFLLFLAVPGAFFAGKRFLKFYAGFLALFLAFNFVKLQPNVWDNNKFLIHWLLATAILAAFFLGKLWANKRAAIKAFAALLLAATLASGVLSVLYAARTNYVTYSRQDVLVAEWIKENVPENAVFASSGYPAHSIALTGRQLAYGSWWNTESWFLNAGNAENDLKTFYATGDCSIAERYGITHVFIGPSERELSPNIGAFEAKHEKIYDANGVKIFETVC